MKNVLPFVIICLFIPTVFAQPYIALISPNGGEQIAAGSRFTITWQSAEITGDVLIEYSVDNGQAWAPVVPVPVANTGMYQWDPVPDHVSRDCLILISDVENQSVFDTSDEAFAIYRCLVLLMTDVDFDCYVGMGDLAAVAWEWLLCGNPLDDNCVLPDCAAGWGDCDGDRLNACETDLTTLNDCGQCGRACSFPNAVAQCIEGDCVMGDCLEGFVDVDGDPSNGCEFDGNCQWISDTDEPDGQFIDANCDGIDGEIARAIFVDVLSGNDGYPGSDMAFPKKTLEAGITAAAAMARDYVLVSQGQYIVQTLNLANGVSIHGGYDSTSEWSRDAANTTTISGGTRCIQGGGISNIRLSYLEIESADTSTLHSSSYAVTLTSSSNIDISDCTIRAGQSGGGQNGSNGGSGVNGQNGIQGQPGCEDSTFLCDSCPRPVGGAGGSSSSGRRGGRGGSPGHDGSYGLPGENGVSDSNRGAGGMRWNTTSCSSSRIAGYPANGGSGADGGIGADGGGGSNFGSVSTANYIIANGFDGIGGQDAQGGGGGGGGRGGEDGCDSYGSSGGGGGGGGMRGRQGYGGTGAGGSFGVWLYSCAGVRVSSCRIITAQGGRGGNGGQGGSGGFGGSGGRAGVYGGSSEQDDGGCGGWGGNGGRGGRGGYGGGGGGGPSVCILSASTTLDANSNTYNTGPAGQGGSSSGNLGQYGVATSIYSP